MVQHAHRGAAGPGAAGAQRAERGEAGAAEAGLAQEAAAIEAPRGETLVGGGEALPRRAPIGALDQNLYAK
jgi:hypothetical protein